MYTHLVDFEKKYVSIESYLLIDFKSLILEKFISYRKFKIPKRINIKQKYFYVFFVLLNR